MDAAAAAKDACTAFGAILPLRSSWFPRTAWHLVLSTRATRLAAVAARTGAVTVCMASWCPSEVVWRSFGRRGCGREVVLDRCECRNGREEPSTKGNPSLGKEAWHPKGYRTRTDTCAEEGTGKEGRSSNGDGSERGDRRLIREGEGEEVRGATRNGGRSRGWHRRRPLRAWETARSGPEPYPCARDRANPSIRLVEKISPHPTSERLKSSPCSPRFSPTPGRTRGGDRHGHLATWEPGSILPFSPRNRVNPNVNRGKGGRAFSHPPNPVEPPDGTGRTFRFKRKVPGLKRVADPNRKGKVRGKTSLGRIPRKRWNEHPRPEVGEVGWKDAPNPAHTASIARRRPSKGSKVKIHDHPNPPHAASGCTGADGTPPDASKRVGSMEGVAGGPRARTTGQDCLPRASRPPPRSKVPSMQSQTERTQVP
eukprot:scaffold47_cov334-Pavlova_lutheri.AAC.17